MSAGGSSPVGYVGALAQIDAIQAQIAAMRSAFSGAASTSGGASVTGASSSADAASTTAGASSSSSFASELQSALASSEADSADAVSADPGVTGSDLTASSLLDSGLNSSLYTGVAGTTGLTDTTGLTGAAGLTSTTSATLPANASTMLTSDQQQFASRLASDTGLDPGVVSAWLLAEESGSAASARQGQNTHDWLNIGYTGSGTYGASDSVWSDPTSAADATAGWLKGQNTIPGYGTASSGIQSILSTAGQAPQQQIAALQGSGWSGSGYPDLGSLYVEVSD
jgi:hypothetical protein